MKRKEMQLQSGISFSLHRRSTIRINYLPFGFAGAGAGLAGAGAGFGAGFTSFAMM